MHRIFELDSAVRPSWAPPSWHKEEDIFQGEIKKSSDIPQIACRVHLEDHPLKPGYVLGSNKCAKDIVAILPDKRVVIHTCSPQYAEFSNDRLFDLMMESFTKHNIPARLSFALTMNNLARVSYCFELDAANEFFAVGEKYKLYLNAINYHDKTSGARIFGSGERVVCHNTMMMALKGVKEALDFIFFHDKTGRKALENLPQLINAVQVNASIYSKLAEQMKNKTLNLQQAHAIALELLSKLNGKTEVSAQVINAAEEVAGLFQNGRGNTGDSLYSLWNGFSEYFTSGNGSGGEKVNKFKKMVSADYGVAADKKLAILTGFQKDDGDLLSDAQINQLIKSGEKLLHEYA